MKNIYSFFLTILILYIVLAEYELLKENLDTILGRIIIIGLLIFYTSIDKYLGLFFCLVVILLLQDRFIENMLNLDDSKYINTKNSFSTFSPYEKEEILKYYKSCPISNTQITELYTNPTLLNSENKYNEDFKKNHCQQLKLKYKNMDVPDDMVKHIFPDLTFHNEQCNICSHSCKFSILPSKLETEKKLMPENTTFL